MKHFSLCFECSKADPPILIWSVGELTNDLYAICTCPNGHKNLSGLMHHIPDILFLSAVRAFRYECYSESILSFTAAFERTCELFFKAFCIKQGSSLLAIEEMWRELKNQSERQYGAFCLAYCITTGMAWKMETKQVEFRNNVVHKGYISTKSEAELYASYITNNIDHIITILNHKLETECDKLYYYNKERVLPKLQKLIDDTPGLKFSAVSIPSLLAWNDGDRKPVTFQDALSTADELENRYGF